MGGTILTEPVVSYGPGPTDYAFVCGDGAGRLIGSVDIPDRIVAERAIRRTDGSVEAVLRFQRSPHPKQRPWVELLQPDGTLIGRMVLEHRYQFEVAGQHVAELRRPSRLDLNGGLDVCIDGIPRAALRLREPDERSVFTPEIIAKTTVTIDPSLPRAVAALAALLPIMMSLPESYTTRTASVPADVPSSIRRLPEGWQPDPFGIGQHRWFDGRWWSDQIVVDGANRTDPRIGVRAVASGGGTVLTEPITLRGKDIVDGARRLAGFVRTGSTNPRSSEFLTVDGAIEATLRIDPAGRAGHTDRLELLGPSGEAYGSYQADWKAERATWGGQHNFHCSVAIAMDGAWVGGIPLLHHSPKGRNAAVEVGGRPAAAITGLWAGLSPGRMPELPYDRFDRLAVTSDAALPMEVRRLIAALPSVVDLIELDHRRVSQGWSGATGGPGTTTTIVTYEP